MNTIASQRTIPPIAGVIASALFLVSIGWSCGGDDDSPPATFADGLTAEEILERAAESDPTQSDIPVRVRVTDNDEVKEITIVGDGTYTVTFDDGDPDKEFLQYGGKSYVRDYGSDSWEREPALDSVFSALRLGRSMIEDMDFDSWSGEVARLPDETVDGQTVFRVRLNASGPIEDIEDEVEAIAERSGVDDLKEIPTDLLPDKVSGTIDLWITAEAFETIRVRIRTMAFVEGENLFDSEETFELLEIGPSVTLPTPLPE